MSEKSKVRKLQTPAYQADLTAIKRSFMNVAQSFSHLPGIDTEAVKQMFLAMTGTVQNYENRPKNQ